MNLNEFICSLEANPSRNYKTDLLQKNSHNEILKNVVRLALDPFILFYVRKIPKYNPNMNGAFASIGWALQELEDIDKNKIRGNAGIDKIKTILESVSVDDAKVVERILLKDLKCGVSTATANAVWENLIPEYPCMLCSQFEQKIAAKIKFPAYAQLKMDGMRFNAIVENGAVTFRSRNGKPIELLGNLEQEFLSISNGQNLVFDGELLVANSDDTYLDRKTGNGIINKAVKGTISDNEAATIHATLWDVIPLDDFKFGRCSVQYVKRFEKLSVMVLPNKINIVETVIVNSLNEAGKIANQYYALGQEGIILKDFSGIWENKRVKTQIKYKAELECDLKVVDVENGTGKYDGMVGSLVCESSDGILKVSVGSGLTDEQRRENYIGKIVAVKYNSRITDKNGNESLFLPIFVEVRDDKNVADSNGDIK